MSRLGVSMYLTERAIDRTLGALSHGAPGTELIMEYALPPHLRDERGAAYAELAIAAADHGEP